MQSLPTPTLPEDFVNRARCYIGTPFRHQGRNELGLDCIGLGVVVSRDLGLLEYDVKGYKKYTNGHEFLRYFRGAGLKEVLYDNRQIADIVVMHDMYFPCHIGILSSVKPDMIIHAFAKRRKVVEEKYDIGLHKRFVGLFRLPNFM